MQQTWRSHMYTLKIGIGDYGQEKIEFFKYDGSGDEMNDTRYIIDRVDSLDRGSRYIRVLRAGDFRYIRIPRTMSDDEERILDQSLRRMMEVGNINSFKPLKGEDPI